MFFPFPHMGVTNQRVPRVCTCVVLPPDFVKHHSAVSCDYSVDGWHSSEQQGSKQAYSPFPPSENVDSSIIEDCQLQTTYYSDGLHLHRITVHQSACLNTKTSDCSPGVTMETQVVDELGNVRTEFLL